MEIIIINFSVASSQRMQWLTVIVILMETIILYHVQGHQKTLN